MTKKLYRSKTDRKIAGVCAGVAEYLDIDVTIVRILGAVVSLFAAIGLILYGVCAFVVPEKPDPDEGEIIDAE